MCSDIIPISSWNKAKESIVKCTTPPKPWYKPWQKKPKQTCKKIMTLVNPSARDLLRLEQEKAAAKKPAPTPAKKTTTTTKK